MDLNNLKNLKYQECLKLLKEDLDLYKEVELLYFQNEKDIVKFGIEDVFNDKNLINLISAYMELNKKNTIDFSFENFSTNDSINMYLKKISNYKNLTFNEEQKLFEEYKKGNKQAKKNLVESHLKLVVFIAKKYYTDYDNFLDLIQEGNMGLLESIEHFDFNKGYKFSTYAYYWIKKYILSYLNFKIKNINTNNTFLSKYQQYNRDKDKLIQQYQRKLSYKELSEYLKIPVKQIYFFEKAHTIETISIDENIYDDDTNLIDTIPDKSISIEDSVIEEDFNSKFKNYIMNCKISDKQKDILIKRYGFEKGKIYTNNELGELYGVRRQRINQLEKNAIEKIRNDEVFNTLFAQIEFKVVPLNAYFSDYSKECLEVGKLYLNQEQKTFLDSFYTKYKVNQLNYCSKYEIESFNNIIAQLNTILNTYFDQNSHHIKTIFELFPDYSKKEILSVINNLEECDKEILFYRYGEDLDNPVDIYWDEEYNDLFYKTILNKIKKRLNDYSKYNHHIKTIYELLPQYPKKDIDNLISLLNEDYKHLLQLRYGEDLDNPNPINWDKKYNAKFYNSLIPYMKKCLDTNNYNQNEVKTLMEILDTREDNVRNIINTLNDYDKKIIYLRYGKDLKNTSLENWDNKYTEYFYNHLIPNMKKILQTNLNKIYLKPIYSYFEDYTEEQVDYIIFHLNDDDKELLSLGYGKELNAPVKNNYYSQLYDYLFPKIAKQLYDFYNNDIKTNKYNYIRIFNFIDDNEYLRNNYSIKDGFIITLRYGLCDNIILNSKEIANVLDLDIIYVKRVAKKVLLTSKELFENNYALVLQK